MNAFTPIRQEPATSYTGQPYLKTVIGIKRPTLAELWERWAKGRTWEAQGTILSADKQNQIYEQQLNDRHK